MDEGIMASELILKLQELVKKHGDLRVVANMDHDPVDSVEYCHKSWIGRPIGEESPAFVLDRWY